jgi:rRNA maturation endonuclease Nob1
MAQIIKTKTTVYNVTNVAIDFAVFDEHWRRIRGNFKYKGFECYACNKHFKDGENISVIFTDRGNKLVCRECGLKSKSELEADANAKSS